MKKLFIVKLIFLANFTNYLSVSEIGLYCMTSGPTSMSLASDNIVSVIPQSAVA